MSNSSRPSTDDRAAQPPSRLAVLRFRDFRLLWGGELVSMIGTQMQLFAVNWQVLQILHGQTHHVTLIGHDLALSAGALGLGVLGLVRVLPILLLAMLGGSFADAHNRRTVITIAQCVAALNAAALAFVSFSGHASIVALYGLTATGITASVFAQPAQQALVPLLVSRDYLTNAYSLYALIWQAGALIGPPLAGVIIAQAGFGAIYTVDALSFVAIVIAIRAIRHRPSTEERQPTSHARAIREGWNFAHGTTLIWQTLMIDLYATFFASARAMVPLIATNVLHVGVRGYGLLASAQPLGAFVSGAVLTLRRDFRRQGTALFVSVAAFGLAWALFGLTNVFALAYVLYAITGATDTVSYVIRTTLRQSLTPDAIRGRVAGVHMTIGEAGPALGELESGLLASVFGAPLAVVTGGLATVVLTFWAALRWHELRGYELGTRSELGEVEDIKLSVPGS